MISSYNSIKSTIENSLSPDFLEIIDDSALHADHYQKDDDAIISHLRVRIASKQFDNKSTLECHRMVKNALKEKFNDIIDKKKIKDINDLEQDSESNFDEKIAIKNSETEDKLFRLLDETSRTNLQKIYEVDSSFSLQNTINHCDFVFSLLMSEMHNGKIEKLSDYCNEPTIVKLGDFLKIQKFDRTLVKIDEIKILSINIDENNNSSVSLEVINEQMIKSNGSFKSIEYKNTIVIGKNIDDKDAKWIILDLGNVLV